NAGKDLFSGVGAPEWAGLENQCTASRYRRFESHLLRFRARRRMGSTTGAAPGARLLSFPGPAPDRGPPRPPSHRVASGHSARRTGACPHTPMCRGDLADALVALLTRLET